MMIDETPALTRRYDAILEREAQIADREVTIRKQLRSDMLDGLMGDRLKPQATVKGNGQIGTMTALQWFQDQLSEERANELLSILARLANRQNDPRDLNELQLQSMAILAQVANEYADWYAPEFAQRGE